MQELPGDVISKTPVNLNIPYVQGNAEEEESRLFNDEQDKLLSLEKIMNPFLHKGGATFGAVIMSVTPITLLGLKAASTKIGEHPVYWATLPAAFMMFCWDVGSGWVHREETRDIARKGREKVEKARIEQKIRAEEEARQALAEQSDAEQSEGERRSRSCKEKVLRSPQTKPQVNSLHLSNHPLPRSPSTPKTKTGPDPPILSATLYLSKAFR